MIDFLIFAVCFLVLLICAVIYLYPGSSKRSTTIPGPEPIDDVEGNLPDIKACGSMLEFLVNIHEQYGPIASFLYGPQLVVSLASPALFKEHSKAFDRPSAIFSWLQPLITANSIQYTNGAEGRLRHATYSRVFSTGAVKHFYGLLQKYADDLMRALKLEAPETHLPLRKYMFACTIKAMLRCGFGKYFDTDEEVVALRAAYDYCWKDMESRLSGDIPTEGTHHEEMFQKHKDTMYSIMEKVMEERRQNPPTSEEEKLFVDALMELDIADEVKKADMVTFLIGGFHNTGLLLTWCLYFVAADQEIQERLYDEIITNLQEDETLTADNYDRFTYLQQVMKETIRCLPLGPFTARFQPTDIQIGGHAIPANTPVLHAIGVVFQDPELYPDPERFDPERFSEENVKARPDFAFEPFGFAGKRKCPGCNLAQVEFCVLISTFIRQLKVNLVPGQVVTRTFGFVTSPTDEVWITVSPR